MSDRIRNIRPQLLSDNWGRLTKYTYEFQRSDGTWQEQVREAYDRGHGAACLLHDPKADTVLLVRQFRMPMYVTDQDPFLIEVPAGLLEGAAPEQRMRAELMEETGYEVGALTHVTDLIMSPGSVTEYLALYLGTYDRDSASGAGGGHEDEGEDIEVLHMPLEDALRGLVNGELRDAKTVCLIQHLALKLGRSLPGG
ncbi:NUDIX domain-containing protein [Gymnodinialimonas sp. 2305UL16-5]|uniref:NUDIX domain-containing protein n=1 Tax=Gymnodinialimonas mytili TaxID=3126503 RepID=UPI00309B6D55